MSHIVCWRESEEKMVCIDREEARDKAIKEYIDSKLQELLNTLIQQHEIEITLDPNTLKGAGRWRRKQQ
jgi:hypothetical protein